MGLAADEGEHVGQYATNSPEDCAARCDPLGTCESFTFCKSDTVDCWLKNKKLTGDETTKDHPANCASYYKICDGPGIYIK